MVTSLTAEEQAAMLKFERKIDDVTLHDDIAEMYKQGQPVSLRDGWHLSDGTACIRKAVLAHCYKQNIVVHSQHTAALFEHGVEGHGRWQRAMENAGYSLGIELKHVETFWKLNFTPDQILLYRGLPHVTEYKMWNSDTYYSHVDKITNKPKKLPIDAVRQNMFYQWFLGEKYHQGLVIVENKDNQKFAVWRILYDYELVKKHEPEFNRVYVYVVAHQRTEKLPIRLAECTSPTDDKPRSCGCCQACFSSPQERIALRRPVAWE